MNYTYYMYVYFNYLCLLSIAYALSSILLFLNVCSHIFVFVQNCSKAALTIVVQFT